MFRRLIAPTTVVGVLLVTTGALAALPPGGSFSDDNGNVHEASIEAIAAVAITKGCNPPANSRYCPQDTVTRGQMAAFLRRALKLPATPSDYFADDNESIFESDINALASAGVTRGCDPPENTRFCPDAPVTRGQMAAFLARAFEYATTPTDYFIDDDGTVFESNINSLALAGVTKGCNPPDNTRFCPFEPVKRDQMASFLTRALDLTPIVPPPAPDPLTLPPPTDDWLAALNWYRAWSGLAPATEDVGLSSGVAAHLRYLERTPDSYFSGRYASPHSENPSSPYYSSQGARSGKRSNLASSWTDRGAIESWMAAPFHAVGLLQPGLRTTGFARGGDLTAYRWSLNAGLDVFSGLTPAPTHDVFFPGPESRISLNRFGGEYPDPTEPCTVDSGSNRGLPIFALLSFRPTASTTARLLYPDGSVAIGTGASSPLCVLTEFNAFSTDPIFSYALGTYRDRNMVLVLPEKPLPPGKYQVQIETAGQTRAWSFEIIGMPSWPSINGQQWANLEAVRCSTGGYLFTWDPASSTGGAQSVTYRIWLNNGAGGTNITPDIGTQTSYRFRPDGVYSWWGATVFAQSGWNTTMSLSESITIQGDGSTPVGDC